MPSNYSTFDVVKEAPDGTLEMVPLQAVNVRDVTNSDDLDDLASDAEGHVAGGSLDVAAGTSIRFSADLGDGQKGYAEQVTT